MNPNTAMRQVEKAIHARFGDEVGLSTRTSLELQQLLKAGHGRAIAQDQVEVYDEAVRALANRVVGVVLLEALASGGAVVSDGEVHAVLKSLCPTWPFC